MWRRIVPTALLACSSVPALAAGGPFGLGVILGNPTGLSAKYRAGANSVDGALAFNMWGGFHLHGDYLWNFPRVASGSAGQMDGYIGVGGVLSSWGSECHRNWCEDDNGVGLGARVPFGLSWYFSGVPLELFGEVAPAVYVIPGTGLDVDLGIGLRFYF